MRCLKMSIILFSLISCQKSTQHKGHLPAGSSDHEVVYCSSRAGNQQSQFCPDVENSQAQDQIVEKFGSKDQQGNKNSGRSQRESTQNQDERVIKNDNLSSASQNVGNRLFVCGTKICNAQNEPVQLRGMSTHGIQWFSQCVTKDSIAVIANDWGANVFRIAMYIQEEGYETDPEKFYLQVEEYVEYATDLGLYVIIDWHILTPGDPNFNTELAKDFFDRVSKKYKDYDNILYEIANEPNGDDVTWGRIKNYADQIIPVIRANDSEAIIIVGTPGWSSLGVSGGGGTETYMEIVNNKINDDQVMYTFHFYAASHGDLYREVLDKAKNVLPLFVTEFGTTPASGEGAPDLESTEKWLDLLDQSQISWLNWTYSDHEEESAAFIPGTCQQKSWADKNQLKPSGKKIVDRLLNQ
ncbi:MAG: glycoside hydrolase family 5 protein [Oligoflexales bacterium]